MKTKNYLILPHQSQIFIQIPSENSPRHLDLAMLPAVEVVAPNGFPGNPGKNRCDQELPAAGAASALIQPAIPTDAMLVSREGTICSFWEFHKTPLVK